MHRHYAHPAGDSTVGVQTRRRSIRLGVVGATAATLAVAAAVSSAAAKPPPGSDPPPTPSTQPRPRPTTTLPENTTPATAPPSTEPRQVRSLVVSADSVTAIATVQYDGTPPSLIVYWGDDTVTELTSPPADQVVLRHVYAAPANGAAFNVVVNATVRGETDSRFVTIKPRYRITQHEASFANEDNCEGWPDLTSEWNIQQWAAVTPGTPADGKFWYQERAMGDLNHFEPLPGSEVSADREAGATLNILYDVYENDEPGTNDQAGYRSFMITPDGSVGVDHLSIHFNDDGTCEARINADIEVQLIVP